MTNAISKVSLFDVVSVEWATHGDFFEVILWSVDGKKKVLATFPDENPEKATAYASTVRETLKGWIN